MHTFTSVDGSHPSFGAFRSRISHPLGVDLEDEERVSTHLAGDRVGVSPLRTPARTKLAGSVFVKKSRRLKLDG